MPLKSKQAKGERGVAGQVDNIALSRDLVDAVQSGVYIVQSRKFVYVNPFFAKLTGYSCEELIGTLSSKLVLPQDRPAVRKKAIRNLKSRLGSKPFEYRFIKKNSEIIWVMERVSSIEYMGQQAALGNCVDITERKRAEEALRENEEKYHNLFDNAMEAIFVAQAGKIVFLNPQMTKMTGYSSEEIMEKPFIDFVHPDDREMVFTENRRWLKQGTISSSYDFRGIKKNGDFTWAQFRAVLITWEGQPATLNFLEDITERKLAERELKQSSERYRNLFENSGPAITIIDENGRYLMANKKVAASYGKTPEEFVGRSIYDFVPKEMAERYIKSNRRLLARGGQREYEDTLKLPTGEERSFLFLDICLKDDDGRYFAIQSSGIDITERKQAEQALRLSEEKFRLLIENSYDIIYTLSLDGILTFVSPAWTVLLGHPVNQVVGQPLLTFIHPDEVATCMTALGEGLIAGQPVKDFEYRACHMDGSWRWHTTSAVPLRDEVGTIIGVEGISRDITERKRMEQKLEETATHDFLTGLPNRVLLLDRFTIAAALAHRNKARIAVMSLDLDKFKSVNDTLGHGAGDQVLKVISTRLTGIIRASDTLARVGGDEFILMMMETDHMGDATAIAQKILVSFKEPLLIDGHQVQLATSIGIAIYPEDGQDLETLTKKSDSALYYSKGHGRNQFKFFNDGDVRMGGDHRSGN